MMLGERTDPDSVRCLVRKVEEQSALHTISKTIGSSESSGVSNGTKLDTYRDEGTSCITNTRSFEKTRFIPSTGCSELIIPLKHCSFSPLPFSKKIHKIQVRNQLESDAYI